jgi:hypothetical protein
MGDVVYLPGMETTDVAMVRFVGAPLEYIASVARRRKLDGPKGVVEQALRLLRLADELEPGEYLAVVGTVNGRTRIQPVKLPWGAP